MNLTKANEAGPAQPPEWFDLYSARKEYSLTDLSPKSVNNLFSRMLNDEALFHLYFKWVFLQFISLMTSWLVTRLYVVAETTSKLWTKQFKKDVMKSVASKFYADLWQQTSLIEIVVKRSQQEKKTSKKDNLVATYKMDWWICILVWPTIEHAKKNIRKLREKWIAVDFSILFKKSWLNMWPSCGLI